MATMAPFGGGYAERADVLRRHIGPDVLKEVECPECGSVRPVWEMVMHLNDSHTDEGWTRERIAGWLDGLGLDLTVHREVVQQPTPGRGSASSLMWQSWKDKAAANPATILAKAQGVVAMSQHIRQVWLHGTNQPPHLGLEVELADGSKVERTISGLSELLPALYGIDLTAAAHQLLAETQSAAHQLATGIKFAVGGYHGHGKAVDLDASTTTDSTTDK